MSSDPLAKLLGFDPGTGAPIVERVEVREVDRVVERTVEVFRDGTSLEARLHGDPEAVLVEALEAIFARAIRKIATMRSPPRTGPLGILRDTCFRALNEVAHRNRHCTGGWIIGKRDNPQH